MAMSPPPNVCKIGGAQSMPRLDINAPLSCTGTNIDLKPSFSMSTLPSSSTCSGKPFPATNAPKKRKPALTRYFEALTNSVLGNSASLPSILHYHGSYNLSKSAPPIKTSTEPVAILHKRAVPSQPVITSQPSTQRGGQTAQNAPSKRKFRVGFKKKGPAPKPPFTKVVKSGERSDHPLNDGNRDLIVKSKSEMSLSNAQREIAAISNSSIVDSRIKLFEQQNNFVAGLFSPSPPEDELNPACIDPEVRSVLSLDTPSLSDVSLNIDAQSLDAQSELNLSIAKIIPESDDYRLVFISSSGSSKSSGLDQLTDSMESIMDRAGNDLPTPFYPRITTTLRQCDLGDGAIFWEDSDWEFHSDTEVLDQTSDKTVFSWVDTTSDIVSLDKEPLSCKQLISKKSLSLEFLPSLDTLNDFSPTRSIEEMDCCNQTLNSAIQPSPDSPETECSAPVEASNLKQTYIFGCNDNVQSAVSVKRTFFDDCEQNERYPRDQQLIVQSALQEDSFGAPPTELSPASKDFVSEDNAPTPASCDDNCAVSAPAADCCADKINRTGDDCAILSKAAEVGGDTMQAAAAVNRSVHQGEPECVSTPAADGTCTTGQASISPKSSYQNLGSFVVDHHESSEVAVTSLPEQEACEQNVGIFVEEQQRSFRKQHTSSPSLASTQQNNLIRDGVHQVVFRNTPSPSNAIVLDGMNSSFDESCRDKDDGVVETQVAEVNSEQPSPEIIVDSVGCADAVALNEGEEDPSRPEPPSPIGQVRLENENLTLSSQDLVPRSIATFSDEEMPSESSVLEEYFTYTLESENTVEKRTSNKLPAVRLKKGGFSEASRLPAEPLESIEEGFPEECDSSSSSSSSSDEEVVYDLYDHGRPDYFLHTIVEESCEESEKSRPASPVLEPASSDLEKYFNFAISNCSFAAEDEDHRTLPPSFVADAGTEVSDTVSEISTCSSCHEDERDFESAHLASSRLENYFMSGLIDSNCGPSYPEDAEFIMTDESGDLTSDGEDAHSAFGSRRNSGVFVPVDDFRVFGSIPPSLDGSDSQSSSANDVSPFDRSEGFDTVKRKKKIRKPQNTESSGNKSDLKNEEVDDVKSLQTSKNALGLTPPGELMDDGNQLGSEVLSEDNAFSDHQLEDDVADALQFLIDDVCNVHHEMPSTNDKEFVESADVMSVMDELLTKVAEEVGEGANTLSDTIDNCACDPCAVPCDSIDSPAESPEQNYDDSSVVKGLLDNVVDNVCILEHQFSTNAASDVPMIADNGAITDFHVPNIDDHLHRFAEKASDQIILDAFNHCKDLFLLKRRICRISSCCDGIVEHLLTKVYEEIAQHRNNNIQRYSKTLTDSILADASRYLNGVARFSGVVSACVVESALLENKFIKGLSVGLADELAKSVMEKAFDELPKVLWPKNSGSLLESDVVCSENVFDDFCLSEFFLTFSKYDEERGVFPATEPAVVESVSDDDVEGVVTEVIDDMCVKVCDEENAGESATRGDDGKSSDDETMYIFNQVMSHISGMTSSVSSEANESRGFDFLENQIKQLMETVSPFASVAGSFSSEDVSSCTSSTLETSSVSSDYGSDTDTLESSDIEDCPTPENCTTPTPADVHGETSQCSSEVMEIYQQVISSLSKIKARSSPEQKSEQKSEPKVEADANLAGNYIKNQIKMLMMSVSGSNVSSNVSSPLSTPEFKRFNIASSSHCSELDSELVSGMKVKKAPRSIDSRSSQDTRAETCSETCSLVSTSSISFEVEDSEGTTESDDPKPSECDVILSIIDDLAKEGKDVLANDNDHHFLSLYSENSRDHSDLSDSAPSVLQRYNLEQLSHQSVLYARKVDRKESYESALRSKAGLEVHNSTESLSDIPEESENSQSDDDETEENKRLSVIWADETPSKLKDPIRDSTTSLSSKDSRNTRDSSTSLSSSKESFVTVISPTDPPPTRRYLSKSDSHSYPTLPVSRKYVSDHDVNRGQPIKSHSTFQISAEGPAKPRRRARKTGAVKQALADLISPHHHKKHSTQMWVESIHLRQKEIINEDDEAINNAKLLSPKEKASSENNLLAAVSSDSSPVIATKSTGHIPDLERPKQGFRDTGYYSLKSSGESIPSIEVSSSSASSMSDHIASSTQTSQEVGTAISMHNISETSKNMSHTLPSAKLSNAESFSSPNIPADVFGSGSSKSSTLPVKSRLTKYGPPNTRSSHRAFLSAAGIVGRLKSSLFRSRKYIPILIFLLRLFSICFGFDSLAQFK